MPGGSYGESYSAHFGRSWIGCFDMTDEELEAKAAATQDDFVRRKRVMEDFRYDEQQEKYWDTTTGNLLGAKSIDGAIHSDDWPTRPDGRSGEPRAFAPSRAINAIDTGLTVEGSTWWPGQPQFIRDVVVSERGAMDLEGAVCYNAYIAPPEPPVTKRSPKPWLDHVTRLYPDATEHEHFFDFCAHAVQQPDEKVNHGLVMAGAQGIGKDTALLPVRRGVGEWNAAEIGPDAITSAYNGHVKSVLLVINEVRPHDEDHKASNFYSLLKPLLASPPEMLPMTLKYANTIYVRNLAHVILTTNDPLTMFIPTEDRRLFVMNSAVEKPGAAYFDRLYGWFESGGVGAVIGWLAKRSLTDFAVTNPPPMTVGKKAIIESATQVRRTFVDDVFERYGDSLGEPPIVFFQKDLLDFVSTCDYFDDAGKVRNLLNAKNFHFKMAERGYGMMRNPNASEWRNGRYRSSMAFVQKDVPVDKRLGLVQAAIRERGEEETQWTKIAKDIR